MTRSAARSATLGILLLFPPATALAQDLVVVQARGIALRPGQVLDSAMPIQLRAGQHVTVISGTGASYTIDGPYNGPAAADQNRGLDLSQKISALVTQRKGRVEAGTARGVIGPDLPEPWLLDAANGGSVCLREGQMPMFWRGDAARSSTLVLMPADRSWRAQAPWPAGVDRLSISTVGAMKGGANYVVTLDGNASAMTVNTVPAILTNDLMRAAWMAEKGCERQAEALLKNAR
jgi:hypothetical protein